MLLKTIPTPLPPDTAIVLMFVTISLEFVVVPVAEDVVPVFVNVIPVPTPLAVDVTPVVPLNGPPDTVEVVMPDPMVFVFVVSYPTFDVAGDVLFVVAAFDSATIANNAKATAAEILLCFNVKRCME